MTVGGCAVWAVVMTALVLFLRLLMPSDFTVDPLPHDASAEGAMARWVFFWIMSGLVVLAAIGQFCKLFFPWLNQRDEDRRRAEFEARRLTPVEGEPGPFDAPKLPPLLNAEQNRAERHEE